MTDAEWKEYFADVHGAGARGSPGRRDRPQRDLVRRRRQSRRDGPFIQRQIRAADIINLERGFNDGGLTGGTGTWSVFAFMRYIDNVHSYGRHVVIAELRH